MQKCKVALAGGGSLYFESVMAELATTPGLPPLDVVLYDVDARRMELMRRVGERIQEKTGAAMTVRATRAIERALDGADFVISSIGVHGPEVSWHKADSDAAAKFGIIHTTGDTVGPAGLSQALRIIPIYAELARAMEKYCPDAVLMNHSNPMSPICRAVGKVSRIHVIGYCHNVANDQRYISRCLKIDPRELDLVVGGTNHMVWLLRATYRGRDIYPKIRKGLLRERGHLFVTEMMDLFGLLPIGGDRHVIEFFPHARRAVSTRRLPYDLQWRSERIRKRLPSRELAQRPAAIELKAAGKLEPWLPKADEKTPEAMGEQVKTMLFGPERVQYVNVPNQGAISNLPDWAVVEVKGTVGMGGARPIVVGELPAQAARWTLAQIYAHELTVDAALEGSRAKALQALACDPMIRDFKEAGEVFDALVTAQGERLGRFRASRSRPRAKAAK